MITRYVMTEDQKRRKKHRLILNKRIRTIEGQITHSREHHVAVSADLLSLLDTTKALRQSLVVERNLFAGD